jgi:RNA recognition motif-containing protein
MLEQKNKIYVGNLEFSLTEDELKKFFEDNGINSKAVDIIKDKYSGRSRGFGFVEVETEEEIQKAIEVLDGKDLKGRALKVSKAREQKERFNRDRRPRFNR